MTLQNPSIDDYSGLDRSPKASAQTVVKARNDGVDAMRIVMAFAVIVLHAIPRFGQYDTPTTNALAIFCRGAVPFFFVASGYFLNTRETSLVTMVSKPLKRLVPLHIAWSAFYIAGFWLIGLATGDNVLRLSLRGILMGGGQAYHLWFIPALGLGLILVSLCYRLGNRSVAAVVTLGLAAVSLSLSSYRVVLGVGGEASRGGILIAPALVFLGTLIRGRFQDKAPALPLSIGISLLAVALVFLEESGIAWMTGSPFNSHDFTIGTILIGPAAFMLAMSLAGTSFAKVLAPLGQISFGVYAIHVFFLTIARLIVPHFTVIGAMAHIALTAAAAIGAALLMARSKTLRPFVA